MEKKYIVDSSFYSDCFNGAIFDGPLRLYFAQYQEQKALEFFHHFSTTFKSYSNKIRNLYKQEKRIVYFFMYPTKSEKKNKQPKGDSEKIFITPFLQHYIIGFNVDSISTKGLELEPYVSFVCDNWNTNTKSNLRKDVLLHLI